MQTAASLQVYHLRGFRETTAILCENVLDDPLTGSSNWLGWLHSPFRYKKAWKKCSRMGMWPHRFDFSHSLRACWTATNRDEMTCIGEMLPKLRLTLVL
jgi:hypothetical protein